jgi:ribonuclease T2
LALLPCLILALLMLFGGRGSVRAQSAEVDHYLLALSWSPTFCASSEAENESFQCGGNRRFAFIVHGLWPQARGSHSPQYCRTTENWVPEEQIEEMLPIMPSKSLIIHEWKKHGTCSGLGMEGYFDLTERLFRKLRIPARYLMPLQPVYIAPKALIADFVKTNRGLSPDMISLVCKPRAGRARLRELRICFSLDGQFAQCRPRRRSDCASETLMLPPVKGKID